MRWARAVPAVAAVVVLGVAFAGYERYIPNHHVERARLSRLLVASAPAGFKAKPTSASELTPASSPFAVLKTAASHAPRSTGAYSVQWAGSSSSTDVASVLAAWLPSASDAAAMQQQATTTYLAATSFKSNSEVLLARSSVPGIAGSAEATFRPASAKDAARLAVVVFRQGRFAVVEFVQQNGAAKVDATSISLAQAEHAHLLQVGPGFSLVVTSWPLAASLIYAGVAVAIAALVIVVPVGVRRGRRHRRLAHEAALRRAQQGRGHKIAKHQAARRR